ncbi:MAG: type II toxin-antitoxin system HicA family toxin [Tepidisphaeraceae bacterium]
MSRLPQLRPVEVVNALKRGGFVQHHQRGSHLYLLHPTTRRMTDVPMHPRDVKRGTLMSILRQAGLSQDQFRELL